MDVSVLSKRRQRSRLSAFRAGVLGNGLLERTRSTSLALLGLTAAIGLAMVALALNQGWPLIAGAPIPGVGGEHRALDDATVVATGGPPGAPPVLFPGTSDVLGSVGAPSAPSRSGGEAPQVAKAPGITHLVAATPGPAGENPPDSDAPQPVPVAQQPAPESTPAPAPAPEPDVASVPVSSPSPVSSGTPESPASSGAPGGDEAEGSGGNPGAGTPVDDEGEAESHDRHPGRGTGRGHGHSRGGGGPDTTESSEGSEAPPVPSEGPAPELEGDSPDPSGAPESGQSHVPSWSRGGGHGYGHDRGHW